MHFHNLVSINTLPVCTGATDLYESLNNHVLLPKGNLDTVLSSGILDDDIVNVSRHRPVACRVSVPLTDFTDNCCSFKSHVKWNKLDKCTLPLYKSELDNAFFFLYISLAFRSQKGIRQYLFENLKQHNYSLRHDSTKNEI